MRFVSPVRIALEVPAAALVPPIVRAGTPVRTFPTTRGGDPALPDRQPSRQEGCPL